MRHRGFVASHDEPVRVESHRERSTTSLRFIACRVLMDIQYTLPLTPATTPHGTGRDLWRIVDGVTACVRLVEPRCVRDRADRIAPMIQPAHAKDKSSRACSRAALTVVLFYWSRREAKRGALAWTARWAGFTDESCQKRLDRLRGHVTTTHRRGHIRLEDVPCARQQINPAASAGDPLDGVTLQRAHRADRVCPCACQSRKVRRTLPTRWCTPAPSTDNRRRSSYGGWVQDPPRKLPLRIHKHIP